VIDMLRRYWLGVRFVFVYNILLLVVSSFSSFFAVFFLIMECSSDKIEFIQFTAIKSNLKQHNDKRQYS